MERDDAHVTRGEFRRALEDLNERMEQMEASGQAAIDALTAQSGQVASDLAAARVTLQAELDALAAANPALNLAGLQAAVSALDPSVQALGALKPDAPGAPPAPTGA